MSRRTESMLRLAREFIEATLAFVAGSGLYLAGVSAMPLRPQDFAGALAAGATAVLLRMYPTRTAPGSSAPPAPPPNREPTKG